MHPRTPRRTEAYEKSNSHTGTYAKGAQTFCETRFHGSERIPFVSDPKCSAVLPSPLPSAFLAGFSSAPKLFCLTMEVKHRGGKQQIDKDVQHDTK